MNRTAQIVARAKASPARVAPDYAAAIGSASRGFRRDAERNNGRDFANGFGEFK